MQAITMRLAIIPAFISATFLSACAGGGGGSGAIGPGTITSSPTATTSSGTGAGTSTGTSTPAPTSPYPTVPTSLVAATGIYAANSDWDQTNYRYAQTVGAKGNDVIVAVVDSGVAPHSKLGDRLLNGIDVVGGTLLGKEDPNGHGTNIAGTIAASDTPVGMVGIAPQAKIAPIRVLDAAGQGNSELTRAGIMGSAALNAKIYNVSIAGNIPSIQMEQALDWIVANGKLMIAGSGNRAQANPDWPAAYAPTRGGYLIAVGGVDGNGQISAFTNKAGTAKDFYLVAPSFSYATAPNESYRMMAGTSQATAIVSGAAAVVWGLWPYLKAPDVSSILLTSAKSMGSPEIYGRGMLDLAAALKPINGLNVVTAQSVTIPVTQPLMQASSLMASSLKAASVDVIYFDGYKRGFAVPLASVIGTPATNAGSLAMQGVDRMVGTSVHSAKIAPGVGFQAQIVNSQFSNERATSQYRFDIEGASTHTTLFNGPQFMPFTQTGMFKGQASFGIGEALRNPYLAMLSSAQGFGQSLSLTPGIQLGFGIANGKGKQNEPINSQLVEARWTQNRMESSVQFGNVQENTTFLGSNTAGVSAATQFVSVGTSFDIGNGFTTMANVTLGKSRSTGTDILTSGTAFTRAMSIGLIKEGFSNAKDRLGLGFSLPNKIVSGQMNLNLPTAVSDSGAAIYTAVPISLASTGQEKTAEMSWTTPMGSGLFGLSIARRYQPGNDATAAPINLMALKLSQRF